MHTPRIVSWLAVGIIVIPFLAVPDWLTKTLIIILSIGIIARVRLVDSEFARSDTPHEKSPNSSLDTKNGSVSEGNQANDHAKTSQDEAGEPEEETEPVDVSDPDADRMIAKRLQRRSSQDVSDTE